jgi:hypothetical protein
MTTRRFAVDTPSAEQPVGGPPLIIGGMHRSGTSLTASLVASAGINLGDQLLGSLPGNDLGHFEDIGFLDFHQLALCTLGLGAEGYAVQPPGPVPPSLERPARQLIAERRRNGRPWGWKEPRTTLFLDFWQRLVPDANYLFVFRRPEDVLDSLLRRGDIAFAHNPRLGLLIWLNYNRLIRDFIRSHPASCMILEISQVIADPPGVMSRIRSQFDIDVGEPKPLFRQDYFHSVDDGSRAEVVRSLVPEVEDVYADLCRHARLDAGRTDAVPQDTALPVVECAVLHWGRAARAENEVTGLRREMISLQSESAALQARVTEAQAEARVTANDAAVRDAERLQACDLLLAAEAQGRQLADERTRLEEANRLFMARVETLEAEKKTLSNALTAADQEHDRLAAALRTAEEEAASTGAHLARLDTVRQELTALVTEATSKSQCLEADLSRSHDQVNRLEAFVRHEQEQRDLLTARLNEALAELASQRKRTLRARLRRWTSKVWRWFNGRTVGTCGQERPAADAGGDAATHKDAA